MTSSKDLGEINRTRTPEQRAAYEKSIGQGKCPFCGELPPEIRSRMIFEGEYWRAWYNPFPYGGHAAHIILAPIEHWTQPGELPSAARLEWFDLNVRLIEKLELPGGGSVMRWGSQEYKGGSISHLHSHMQVPDKSTFAIAVFFADPALLNFFDEVNKG